MSGMAAEIREARPSDVPAVLELVHELARYEREPDAVVATEHDFRDALFGVHAAARCHVAVVGGEVVGFAIWYRTFSTWLGKPGMWLEDLFVRPEHRGAGLGKQLLVTLAGICVERGWPRFEWWVLDWNEPAQGFYTSLGARAEDDWTVWRVAGRELERLASDGEGLLT
jgi:GNAT superfamily N-acetyltransferase